MPPATDLPGVISAHPTILIDRSQFNLVTELALALRITEQEGGLSALELRLSNVASNAQAGADLAFDDDTVLKLGGRITVYTGNAASPTEVFSGIITALEAEFSEEQPPELVVLAEDPLQQARMQRRTATHADITVSQLATKLAERLGLKPRVGSFGDKPATHVQLNESDLAFLRRTVARFDGDLQVVGQELHVTPRKLVARGAVALRLHEELRHARIVADLADQVNTVTVGGWDPEQGQRISVTGRPQDLGPGSGQTGATALGRALQGRSHHVAHLAAATQAEAQGLADAIFAERARRFVRVEATAEGNPAIRVGTSVTLAGVGRRFGNVYYVTRAVHRWDLDRGYETDFDAECAYWGGR